MYFKLAVATVMTLSFTVSNMPYTNLIYAEDVSEAKEAATPDAPIISDISNANGGITFKWTEAKEVTSYSVFRKSDQSDWKLLSEDVAASSKSYTDTTVKNNKYYTYKIKAVNQDQESEYSNKVSMLRVGVTKINSISVLSKTSMKLDWTKNKDAEGYYIYSLSDKGAAKKLKTIDDPDTVSVTLNKLTYGNKYTLAVAAYKTYEGERYTGEYENGGTVKRLKVKSEYKGGYKLYYDLDGNLLTDVEKIIGKQKEYLLKVNIKKCVLTVYAKDADNKFSVPVKSWLCSPGDVTKTGTYSSGQKYTNHPLFFGSYAQWAVRIYGNVLFHTVPYSSINNDSLSVNAYNKLGTVASHGCIRLQCEAVKWIYDNCKQGTTVKIYKSNNPGPFGKPTLEKLPTWHTWDPTDPNYDKIVKAKTSTVKTVSAKTSNTNTKVKKSSNKKKNNNKNDNKKITKSSKDTNNIKDTAKATKSVTKNNEKTVVTEENSIMSNKIVFLDVDGTLIDYEAKTPDSAKKAVEAARKNGNKVYICTGCSKAEIEQRDLPQLDGIIGANGGYVETGGKVILHQSLTYDQCKHIVDWCNERHLGFYLESNSGMYCNDYFMEQAPETMIKYAQGKGADLKSAQAASEEFISGMIHTDDLYRDDVNKISFILSSYQDHLDSKKEFPELEANTWGGKGEMALYGDLGPTGITKKHAIEVLLDYLDVSKEDTISFGDAKIDLSMFELCNFNVAMGNGGPEIKAAADYITDDVNKDGLYNAFKHLRLIE